MREAIEAGDCDAIGITRALIANPDLPRWIEQGRDEPPRPCTHCNRCLYNVANSPMGCYDVSRFDGDHARMIDEVFSVFRPNEFEHQVGDVAGIVSKAVDYPEQREERQELV